MDRIWVVYFEDWEGSFPIVFCATEEIAEKTMEELKQTETWKDNRLLVIEEVLQTEYYPGKWLNL